MTEEMNQVVYLLREGACCCACNEAYPTIDRPYSCEQRIRTNNNMDKAADLIESLCEELEQVKQERDGLSIMLTNAASTVHAFKRKLEEDGRKGTKKIPLVLGRMNSRYDGYNALFSAIDEMPEKPCGTCLNRDWDMPQCRECNPTNNFHWYVKER